MWTARYTHTDFNAVATRTDARRVVTTYTYDHLHRLTNVTYDTSGALGTVAGTQNVAHNYDNSLSSTTKGMLLSVVASGAGVSTYQENYSYDSYNRVRSRTWTRDGLSHTVDYQYNAIDQPRQVGHMFPEYDNKGRLLSVRNFMGGNIVVTNISYNVAGQVREWRLVNGVTEYFGYNNRMQMEAHTAWNGSTNLINVSYNYEAIAGQNGAGTTAGNTGQVMTSFGTINGTDETAVYHYDLVGRLVSSSQTTNGVSAQRRFAYDRWGNRTGVWNATTGGTQIQSASLQQSGGAPTNRVASVTEGGATKNYTYDEAGNLTSDGSHTYLYDAENRLVGVDLVASSGFAYAYDPQNRRIKKWNAATGAWTHTVWEGSQILWEKSSSGAVLATYWYLGSRLIKKDVSGVSTTYYLSDRLSIRLVLDWQQNVIGRQGHLPFGEEVGTSGEQGKYKFTSYERDSESGTDYAINRGYSPVVGRFMQADPYRASGYMVDPQSWNRYSYTRNNPVNRIDPLGLEDVIVLYGWAPYPYDPTLPGAGAGVFGGQSTIGLLLGGGEGQGGGGERSLLPQAEKVKTSRERVSKFFEDNVNCAEVFEARGLLSDVLAKAQSATIVNLVNPNNAHYLNMTFGQAGFTADAHVLNKPIGDRLGPNPEVMVLPNGNTIVLSAPAWAGFDNQTILLGWEYHTNYGEKDRSIIMVHETMHLVIPGNHLDLAKRLGLKDQAGNDFKDDFRGHAGAQRTIWAFLESNCTVTRDPGM